MTAMDLFTLIVEKKGGFNHYMDTAADITPYHVGPFIGTRRQVKAPNVPVVVVSLDVDGEEVEIKIGLQLHKCGNPKCTGGIETVVEWLREPSDMAKTKLRLAL